MVDEPLADDINRRRSDDDDNFVPHPDKLKPRRSSGTANSSTTNTNTSLASNSTTTVATNSNAGHIFNDSEVISYVHTDARFSEFINRRWRPMMGWTYMLTCITDFVLFPILWSMIQAIHGGQVHTQWAPLTLQGAGLYHIAMGAILGLAAYGRTQEKIAGKA